MKTIKKFNQILILLILIISVIRGSNSGALTSGCVKIKSARSRQRLEPFSLRIDVDGVATPGTDEDGERGVDDA
jgi:hypothetical protein